MRRKAAERLAACTTERDDLSDVSDCEDSYDDRIRKIESELRQLDQKCHPEYLRLKRKIDAWHVEEKLRAEVLNDHRLETIHREYKKDIEACDQECEVEKRRILDYLMSLCEELKKRLEQDKRNIELTPSGDILDFKPAVTRKLRRRAAGCSGATGELASSTCQNNLTYWSDLFCGSLWSLTPSSPLQPPATCKAYTGDVPPPVKSPTPVVDAGGGESYGLDSIATTTDMEAQRVPTDDGSTAPVKLPKLPRINLFGSLGLNMFGGSLLSHLLTSFNATAASGLGCSSSSSAVGGSLTTVSGGTGSGGGGISGTSGGAAAYCQSVPVGALGGGLLAAPGTGQAAAFIGPQSGGLVASPLPGLHPPQQSSASTKRRRQQSAPPSAQLNLLLPEDDIKTDLTVIHSVCTDTNGSTSAFVGFSGRRTNGSVAATATLLPVGFPAYTSVGQHLAESPGHTASAAASGKPGDIEALSPCHLGSTTVPRLPGVSGNGLPSSPPLSPPALPTSSSTASSSLFFSTPVASTPSGTAVGAPAVWIDDGRLYCGQKCFQTGASVILEGREGSNQRFPGTIVSVGAQDVAIRRSSDHGICRVTVQQLKQGRYALWMNAKPS